MIALIAHNDTEWPGSYRVYLKSDGRLVAVGKDALACATARLTEEGMDTSKVKLVYAGKAPVSKPAIGKATPEEAERFRRAIGPDKEPKPAPTGSEPGDHYSDSNADSEAKPKEQLKPAVASPPAPVKSKPFSSAKPWKKRP